MLMKCKRYLAFLAAAILLLTAVPLEALGTITISSNILATPDYNLDPGFAVGELEASSPNQKTVPRYLWISTENGETYMYFAVAIPFNKSLDGMTVRGVSALSITEQGMDQAITIGQDMTAYQPYIPGNNQPKRWFVAKFLYSAIANPDNSYPMELDTGSGGFNVTVTFTVPQNVTITVRKTWQGANPTQDAQFIIRRTVPGSPAVSDHQDYTLTVPASPAGVSSSASVSGLPYYYPDMRLYEYNIFEINPGTGFYTNYMSDRSHTPTFGADGQWTHTYSWMVTNAQIPTINIRGRKVWAEVPDGQVLPAVSLRLMRQVEGGQPELVATGIPDASGYVIWENQPAINPMGSPYTYSLEEDPVPVNYQFSYSYDGESEGWRNLTGTNTWQTMDYTFTKTWLDGMGGAFPRNATFVLQQDGVDYRSIAWNDMAGADVTRSHTFTGLPVYKDHSTPYSYSIKELAVPGYTTAYSTDTDGNMLITNTLDASQTIAVTANKVWVEGNYPPAADKRAFFALQADGVYLTGSSIELDGTPGANGEDSPWHATWPNLPAYRLDGSVDGSGDPIPIQYTVIETWAPTGYSRAVRYNGAGDPNYTVTNTNRGAVFNLQKVWDGDPPAPGTQVSFQLYRGIVGTPQNPSTDTPIGPPITMEASPWRHTWYDLEAASADTPPVNYQYYAREVSAVLPGYYDAISSASARISNFQQQMRFTATKAWDGGAADKRPGVTLTLKRYAYTGDIPTQPSPIGAVEVIGSITLPDEDGNWTATWDGLDRLSEPPQDGQQAERWIYFVEEAIDATSPYAPLYPADQVSITYGPDNTSATVTNSYVSPSIAITVNKVWVGGPRAGSQAQLRLHQNGSPYGEVISTQGTDLSYTWDNLPQTDHEGVNYSYTVVEQDVPTYYDVAYTPQNIAGEDGSITVTNTYTAVPLSMPAPVAKRYTGRMFYPEGMSEQFDFQLTGPKIPSGQGSGSITFDASDTDNEKTIYLAQNIEFSLDDLKNPDGSFDTSRQFVYTMKELIPESPAAWINYDADSERTITVTLTDNGNGTLSLRSEGSTIFNNSYKTSPVVLSLAGTKTLANLPLSAFPEDGLPFTFHVDGDGFGDEGEDITVRMPANGSADIQFSPLTFRLNDLVGQANSRLLSYTIRETIPPDADKVPGLQYDGQVYTLYYHLHDDGYGNLGLTAVDAEGNQLDTPPDIAFANSYRTLDAQPLSLSGTKKLSGRTGSFSDSFSFTLAGDKLPAPSTASLTFTENGEQTFSFGPLTFTFDDLKNEDGSYASSREFSYTVSESFTIPGVNQQSGGNTNIKILVTDNGNGTLSAQVTSGPVLIHNAYRASDAEPFLFSGTKALSGRTGSFSDTFSFTLAGDKLPTPSTTSLTFTENGEQTFNFGPLTFTFDDLKNGNGDYVASRDFNYSISEDTYTIDGVAPTGATSLDVTLRLSDLGDGRLQVELVDNPTVAFANAYTAAGEWTPAVTKQLSPSERALKANEFKFELRDAEGEVLQTVYSGTDGSIGFAAIPYDESHAGQTFTYTIQEIAGDETGMTYDTQPRTVTVDVADNGDGSLLITPQYQGATVFSNSYLATGSWIPQVNKILEGRDLTEGAFSFLLLDGGGNEVGTASNLADTTVTFAAIPYDQTAIGKSYSYSIKEIIPPLGDPNREDGMAYDGKTLFVNVRVTDLGNGQLQVSPSYEGSTDFNNVYTAEDSWRPLATKDFQAGGRLLKEDEFQFRLFTGDDTVPTQTKGNTADGEVVFDALTFTQADVGNTYHYTIREVVPASGDPGYEEGVTYASDPVTISLSIEDAGGGKLRFVPTYTPNDATFVNRYAASGSFDIDANLGVKKLLDAGGRLLESDEFNFTLSKLNPDTGSYEQVQTASNDADGKVSFSALGFAEADIGKTYTYQVKEVVPNTPEQGMSYSANVLTFTLTVTDQGGGVLQIAHAITGGTTTFTNTYSASDTFSIVDELAVTKLLEAGGRQLKPNEFNFTLSRLNPDTNAYVPVETKANLAGGSVPFSDLTFTQADIGKTYTYRVAELVPDPAESGMTYSDKVLEFTILVEDATGGALKLTHAVTAGSTTFTNSYQATGSYAVGTQIPLMKVLSAGGRVLEANEFSFTLSRLNPDTGAYDEVQTVTNALDGKVSFSTLDFTEADIGKTYTYQVKELVPGTPEGGMSYSENVYEFQLQVTDLGGGKLRVARVAQSGDLQFTNTYSATGKWSPLITKHLDAGAVCWRTTSSSSR